MVRFKTALLMSVALCVAAPAMAQLAPNQIPRPADAGRFDEPFRRDDAIQLPSSIPAYDDGKTPLLTPPPGAEQARFVLKEITITGMTVYDQESIVPLYREKIGTTIPLTDIYAIANALGARYAADGYVLSRVTIPAQEIDGGTVTLQVVEGYVDSIRMEGATFPGTLPQETIRPLTQERPLKASTLEHTLLLLNDLPGIAAKAVLEPLEDKNAPPGAVGMVIVLEEEAYRSSVSFDNYGSRYLGPNQLGVRSGVNNPLPYLSQTGVTGFLSMPADELEYIAGTHIIPLNASGTSLSLAGNYGRTTPGFTLRRQEIIGMATGVSASLTQPIIRSRAENFSLGGELAIRNVNSDVLGTLLYRDRLRTAKLFANYDNVDSYSGINFINLSVTQGLDVLGASDKKFINLSRTQADGTFTKAEANISRVQGISKDFSAYAALAGQYSSDPLLSSEEFGYGGQAFGRAYNTSEITGDHGITGMVELRYSGVPEWHDLATQIFAFYDAGKVWNSEQGGQSYGSNSTGLGVRLNYSNFLSGEFTLVQPLQRRIATPVYGNNGKNPHLLFSINYRF